MVRSSPSVYPLLFPNLANGHLLPKQEVRQGPNTKTGRRRPVWSLR